MTRHRTPTVDRCPDSMAMRSRFDVRSSARVRDALGAASVPRCVPRRARAGDATGRRIESGRANERTNERSIDRSTSGRGRCVSLDDGDDDGKIGAGRRRWGRRECGMRREARWWRWWWRWRRGARRRRHGTESAFRGRVRMQGIVIYRRRICGIRLISASRTTPPV